MSRIRLNNEKRDKLFKVARNFRMNDTTDSKLEKMRQAKENCDNDLPKFLILQKVSFKGHIQLSIVIH